MHQRQMVRSKMYHVVQRPDRLWEVRKFGEPISLHGSEMQAVDYAISLAHAGQGILVKARRDDSLVLS